MILEILFEFAAGERHLVQITFLFLRHDGPHYVDRERSLLTEFL